MAEAVGDAELLEQRLGLEVSDPDRGYLPVSHGPTVDDLDHRIGAPNTLVDDRVDTAVRGDDTETTVVTASKPLKQLSVTSGEYGFRLTCPNFPHQRRPLRGGVDAGRFLPGVSRASPWLVSQNADRLAFAWSVQWVARCDGSVQRSQTPATARIDRIFVARA